MSGGQAAYSEFLKTPHWKVLRFACLKRDGFKCQKCGTSKRLQAHHTIYRNGWEDTRVEDLITLCNKDHKKQHRKKS